MFNKTLISEFFTTISFKQAIQSTLLLTFKLPFLRYWNHIEYIENEFLSYIWNNKSKIISFYNWRSAIYHALKIIWISKNDEVIVSWYTCVSVSNAVIQTWAKIKYSDIEKSTLWLDTNELKKNITKKTKVIIIQHTFWKAANIKEIVKLAKLKNILIIEDCAHSLWSRVDGVKLWNFWDFSIFSTGRDKVISSVTWWFLIINNSKYFSKINDIKKTLIMPSIKLTIQNLNYNIFWYKAYKMYDFFKIWKIVIFLSRRLNLITEILTQNEKQCNYKILNYKLPNSLAYLISKQIQKIKLISSHRRTIWEYYNNSIDNKNISLVFKDIKWEKNNYYRFPILLKSKKIKNEFYEYMKSNNILLWNYWSWQSIIPTWTNQKNAWYNIWTCPISENISERILTLPNHKMISIDDAFNIVKILNNFKK